MSLSFLFGGRGGGFYLDYGMYEELKTVPGYVYNGLFSIGEDSFRTRIRPAFATYLKNTKNRGRFQHVRDYTCILDLKYEGRESRCSELTVLHCLCRYKVISLISRALMELVYVDGKKRQFDLSERVVMRCFG